MGEQTKKAVVAAQRSGIVVGSGSRSFHLGPRLRLALLGVVAIVLLAVVVGGVWSLRTHAKQVRAQRAAEQHKLQQSTHDADAMGDPQQLKQDTTTLINGATSGKYDVSNANLGKAYSDRGYVELNSSNYQAALDDFKKAEQLDSTSKAQSQYGEFLARYHLGERKTLIPLLQELEKPLKGSKEVGAAEQLVQYEDYISSLQAGKDLTL